MADDAGCSVSTVVGISRLSPQLCAQHRLGIGVDPGSDPGASVWRLSINVGGDDFLMKPFNVEDVMVKIEAFLGG